MDVNLVNLKMTTNKIDLPWAAVGLTFMIWLVSIAYGFQYAIGDDIRLPYFRAFTLPFVLIVAAMTWRALSGRIGNLTGSQLERILALSMMTISWLMTCFFYSAQLSPLPWWLCAAGIPMVAAVSVGKWGMKSANLVFLIGLVLISAYLMTRVPNHSGADMLQIIEFAANDILNGESPFRPYLTSSGKEVSFGYWPGTWLPYVPFVAVGVDMRFLNLAALVLLTMIFAQVIGKRDKADVALSLTIYPFLLSPSVMQHILLGHLWMYWLAACITILLVVKGRNIAAALVFGFCLASRPTALFFAAPLIAYVWANQGPKKAIMSTLIATAITAAFNLPFALIYGDAFWQNSYGKLVGFGQQLTHFSLAGYLNDFGLKPLAMPIQVAVLLGSMAIVFLKRKISAERLIMLAGATYIWMILFNSYATRYVYFTGVILLALGLSMHYAQAGREKIASA